MQLLEIYLLRYINDQDLDKHIEELQLLHEGEAYINRTYQLVGEVPIHQLIRHFHYKWEVLSLRLRIAHSMLYDSFNSENLYNFDEEPHTREEIVQATARRLSKIELTKQICYITLHLIQNIDPFESSSNIERDHLRIAYRLIHQLGDQQE